MSKTVELELSDEIFDLASKVANQQGDELATVLTTWLHHAIQDLPIETLSDEVVLTLADIQMSDLQQSQLSNLLEQQRESRLTPEGKAQLNELMRVYSRGMVRKSEALREAVQRGLRAPLG